MAGLGIALYTDEDVHAALAVELRRRGYDAESCHEAGRGNRAIPDEEQLAYATEQGRVIITFNAADYILLDQEWKAAGRQHIGIVVSPKINDLGELLRRVTHHLDTTSPDIQRDILLWLRDPADTE